MGQYGRKDPWGNMGRGQWGNMGGRAHRAMEQYEKGPWGNMGIAHGEIMETIWEKEPMGNYGKGPWGSMRRAHGAKWNMEEPIRQ